LVVVLGGGGGGGGVVRVCVRVYSSFCASPCAVSGTCV